MYWSGFQMCCSIMVRKVCRNVKLTGWEETEQGIEDGTKKEMTKKVSSYLFCFSIWPLTYLLLSLINDIVYTSNPLIRSENSPKLYNLTQNKRYSFSLLIVIGLLFSLGSAGSETNVIVQLQHLAGDFRDRLSQAMTSMTDILNSYSTRWVLLLEFCSKTEEHWI